MHGCQNLATKLIKIAGRAQELDTGDGLNIVDFW